MTEKIQLRQTPSGKFLEGTADNDVPLWDNTLRLWGTGPQGGGAVKAASSRATAATNSSLTSATPGVFVIVTGAAFAEGVASPGWTFTAAANRWTYAGPAGRRFQIQMVSTHGLTFEGSGGLQYQAIDQNGALVGVAAAANFTEGVSFRLWNIAETSESAIRTIVSTRIVEPAPGDFFRPVYAHAAATDVFIQRLTWNIVDVGSV